MNLKNRDFHVRKVILKQSELTMISEYMQFMNCTSSKSIKNLLVLGYVAWKRMLIDYVQRKDNSKESK